MSTFYIKQGDTLPRLSAVLKDGADVPLDLDGADGVTFRLRKADGTVVDTLTTAYVTDGSDGAVEVDLSENTSEAGDFLGEFVIDWGTDTQTVPGDDYVRIKIIPALE